MNILIKYYYFKTFNITDLYNKEYLHILDTAKINGFKEKTVKKKIGEFKRMKSIHEISTLSSESPKKTYTRMTFHPWMFNKLKFLNHTIYRIYANNPHIFFPEFSEEKLGCAHYSNQGWYRSASKQMIASRVKE